MRGLLVDPTIRMVRAATAGPVLGALARLRTAAGVVPAPAPLRTIRDAGGQPQAPGATVVRREGDAASGDPAADEAYDGLGATFALFWEAFGRNSIDDAGLPLDATVHYDRDYDNAFWDGTQMVFGDGDGQLFNRFTIALDVIGHELTHGVTEKEAGLAYYGQSGALNESISDVFGSLVKQHLLGQDADQADWLIGAGLLTPAVQGTALRSMKAPGTAYDDPVLGKDPQPADMAGFVRTNQDNGGVHINSGIPNRAFQLAATAIGGKAWERAGQIWYDALLDPATRANTDFAGFAQITRDVAARRYGAGGAEATAVADAWATVGVI
jgi:Zn-dependent metalloprotease